MNGLRRPTLHILYTPYLYILIFIYRCIYSPIQMRALSDTGSQLITLNNQRVNKRKFQINS